MKHFQLFSSSAFLLCFFTINAQNLRTDQIISFSSDTHHGDIAAGYDGSIIIAGFYGEGKYFEGGHAFVQKYDADHHLIWTCNLDSAGLINYYQSITSLQLVVLQNGTIVLAVGRFECDVFFTDVFAGISGDGEFLWKKNIPGSFDKLNNWTPNTFTVRSFSQMLVFNGLGEQLPSPSTAFEPRVSIPLPGNNSLQSDLKKVWIINESGQQTGNVWTSPLNLLDIDTLADGAGFMAISMNKMFLLKPTLDTIIEIAKPGLTQYLVHSIPGGFLALGQTDLYHVYLYRWNNNLETTGSLELRTNMRADLFAGHYSHNFLILNNRAHICATLTEGGGQELFLLSCPIDDEGVWTTKTDLSLQQIILNGTPTGKLTGSSQGFPPHTTYRANYTRVQVEVKNEGLDTINHFTLRYRAGSCDFFQCYIPDQIWQKTFDNAGLAPGETRLLDFDSIVVACTTSDIRDFCVWANDVNYTSDDNNEDNEICRYFSGIVSAVEPDYNLAFSALPNPAGNRISVQLPRPEELTSYKLTNASGRLVREVQTTDINIPVNDLPVGMYIIEVRTKNGVSGRQKLMIMR